MNRKTLNRTNLFTVFSSESGTKEFDRMAFKYLGMIFFPLAVCYCIYSVIYNEHKGWYSFILSSCYGFLLTFGK